MISATTGFEWPEPLTAESLQELYPRLCAPLATEAVERTKKELTRKGYDTTGYQYAYLVEHLNAVLGPHHWKDAYHDITIGEKAGKERIAHDVSLFVTLAFGNWRDGIWQSIAEHSAAGGHVSYDTRGDALKGAMTNAVKKCLAMFGHGKGLGINAYKGTIDDDYRPPGSGKMNLPPPSKESWQAKCQAAKKNYAWPIDVSGAFKAKMTDILGKPAKDFTEDDWELILRKMSEVMSAVAKVINFGVPPAPSAWSEARRDVWERVLSTINLLTKEGK